MVLKYGLIIFMFVTDVFGIHLLFSQSVGINKIPLPLKISTSMCEAKQITKMSQKEYQKFQWNLFKNSFNAKWHSTQSYIYNSDNTIIDIIPKTKYELTFYQNNTCLWKGSGLRFTKGVKELYYNESNLNNNGMIFLFPGCGGHSYRYFNRSLENKIIPIEVNFFIEDIRSMIIVYYKVSNTSIMLDSIQITPFRNASKDKINNQFMYVQSVEDIVQKMMINNWYGERYSYTPDERNFNKMILNGFNLFPYLSSDKNLVKNTFEDGLVMVVPKIIPFGKHFKLLFGAMMSKNLYKQLIIDYNTDGNLTKWTYDNYIVHLKYR